MTITYNPYNPHYAGKKKESDVVNIGDTPIISIWHDDNNLSVKFTLPKQSENYNVDVWASDNQTGELYDLTGLGEFVASDNHNINFYDMQKDTILSGHLFGGDGALYDYLDVSGIDGTYTLHVELTGMGGDIIHDVSSIIVL